VAKVGTSNPDRTIRLQCVVNNNNNNNNSNDPISTGAARYYYVVLIRAAIDTSANSWLIIKADA
jgi:hypothetical protein